MRHPERRLLICVDMERYSRRSNVQQYEAQRDFHQLLEEAASDVGLDRVGWTTQQAGDGELAILPRDLPEARIIGRFVPELNRRLRRYNASRLPVARIRLRVAVHQGMVHLDGAKGFPGQAVVLVSRLCDAAVVRRALAAFPDGGIALVVSSDIYRDVVTEYPEEIRPERFRRIDVVHADKGFQEQAWLCVVDEDITSWVDDGSLVPTLPPGDPTPEPTRSTDPERGGSVRAGSEPGGAPPVSGGIRTGDITVEGQNAIGPGAMAIGSVGRDAILRPGTDR
ncbi:hypothetical protein SAMN05443287_101913 [Micromonospora phaseoli]|uniref:Guanylate cyclase domain-containing protein n=1 Tax=Micromonospora phaseoli TaxID=1144548 RepID=A0A1H6SYX6_9ACTN|nr:hypothetical protein [Micromonospora phaseoli]PZW04159.1 hypothetical protein CLV64_101913 [Micromonospora phaseoli]GIJ79345.1 hypothetical protein Xph01_37770 [Micromonospora phaseoli]SEI72991.1 hypothetical protein SAMN05443287_101913 [Micromonospora phaseoli]